MRSITAQFIGQPSLGYETGKEYTLVIWAIKWHELKRGQIRIAQFNHGGFHSYCEYTNIETFLKNWTRIREMADVGHYVAYLETPAENE